ncbi:MAG: serine hydrolase [Microcystaceae cyanobacterium]
MARQSRSSSRPLRSVSSKDQTVTVMPRTSSSTSATSRQTGKREDPPILTVKAKPIKSRPHRPQTATSSPFFLKIFFYLLRLAVVGVGLGAIAGAMLPFIDPINWFKSLNLPIAASETPENSPPKTKEKGLLSVFSDNKSESIEPTKELSALNTKLTTIAANYPNLKPQAFFMDLDNGNYVNFNGDTPISAASTIKIPILVAFFQDVDAGKVLLDEMLVADQAVIAGGSGDMQYQEPGKKYTALVTATKMNVISDNTATNMLIRRLGGKEALNERFKQWGMTETVINNPLPDLEGTNTTSPKDLALLMAKISQGELVSLKSRDRLLGIMEKTRTRTLLPQGIEKDAIIAHKTGDIGSVLGDAGVIDIPIGKRYVGAVLTKRPHNDMAGRKIIQDISRTAYQHFKHYLPRSTSSAVEENSLTMDSE